MNVPQNYRLSIEHLDKRLSIFWHGDQGLGLGMFDPHKATHHAGVRIFHVQLEPVGVCALCNGSTRGPFFKGHGFTLEQAFKEADTRRLEWEACKS